ncbi:DMT family transporter [Elioraea sp.]|uniref:DMT family transporter n=1 Tax=Elioraea sp. TaxID=2185103 RepID=UPI0021DE4440|nr:DMT family transporter [Elioraea sp.]GIX09066.1 MAG: RhaT family transporter [Elioraea sp.]
MKRPPAPIHGIGFMLLATALFAGMTACNKAVLAAGTPLPLVMLSRAVLTMVLLAPWLVGKRAPSLATRRVWLHLGRGVAGVSAMGLSIAALALIPLADVIALGQARPLWLLVIAVAVLGETVGWRRPLAAAIGFAGVMVILFAEPRAGALGLNPGALLALAASFCGACVLAFVRSLASLGEPPIRVVFWYGIVGCAAWLPPSLWWWRTPSPIEAALLGAAAAFATLGDLCASLAARRAEASLLAPVEFVAVPIGALIGWAVFAERPGWPLAVGAALMAVSVGYIARREAQLRRLRPARTR